MSAAQRPGEITYYEELGLDNTASADEIRDAFRALARLLHPDGQTDPQLKEVAERQMRKLNRIYSVLSDPTRRTGYDDSLLTSHNAPIIVFSGSDGNLKKLLTRLGAAAAIVVGVFLLIWFAIDSNNSAEVRGQDSRNATNTKSSDNNNDGDSGDQVARLRAQVRTLETERNSALAQLARLSGKTPDTSADSTIPKENAPVENSAESAAPAKAPAAKASPAPEQSITPATQFVGVWVYSKSGTASPGGKSQYPPEFIELTVTEQKGVLHGMYHSRYQVLDHAISPDVDFVFSGAPGGSSLTSAWQGTGGAKGHVMMKILPGGSLDVTWNATELGSQQWLVSGTSTLARK